MGAYGNQTIHTPSLDAFAAKSIRFYRHYIAAFPTMPTRVDNLTGRWTMSFMQWEPLPKTELTLPELLAEKDIHTAGIIDTPFCIRRDMNYDRGFRTFTEITGQTILIWRGDKATKTGRVEHTIYGGDVKNDWRHESDCFALQTLARATEKDSEATVTTDEWTLLCNVDPGMSELYHLKTDPGQEKNLIAENPDKARELHQQLVKFLKDTEVPERVLTPRLELRL